MITEVNMERKLFGETVSQKSKSEFLSATELVKAGNKWRFSNDRPLFNFHAWLNTEATKTFIAELEVEFGKVVSKGKQTWVHPFLFIDLALAISPKLKVETYKWMHDQLLANRNNSGDSYKCMSGALYAHQGIKAEFPIFIRAVAKEIRVACNVSDWQSASEEQLKKRNKIHNDITLLANVLRRNNDAVRLGLQQNRSFL